MDCEKIKVEARLEIYIDKSIQFICKLKRLQYTLQLSHLIIKRLVQYLLKQIHKDPLL